jgi:iron complex transport system ATP-binding protein
MISFKDIQIGYKEVLFSVPDLTLNTGQLVALIGPNGAGKTTFLHTILGLHKPISGELLFHGKEFSEMTKSEKTKLLSHVASKFEGVNYLSVADLIAMGRAPYTNMLNVLSTEDHKIVNRIISELDLSALASASTTNISDGERQIAMIGKALAQETEIIILDEPTAFLDYNNRRKVLRILKTIAANQNKLILLTSHDLELCFEHSDQVIGVDEANKSLRVYSEETPKEKIIQEIFGEK